MTRVGGGNINGLGMFKRNNIIEEDDDEIREYKKVPI